MIKRWILKWIYKNININNFEALKEHETMLALLNNRVNDLEEKLNE